MRILAILSVATVLGTSALVSPAWARDGKGLPGAMCEAADPAYRSAFTLTPNGIIF